MSTVLITGINSYIGSSFAAYLREDPAYKVEGLSLRDPKWRERSFAGVDTLLHTVGLTHVRETAENASAYYEVNRDLTLETAQKAKEEGVRQFIFLSTMSVYGLYEGIITPETELRPINSYGRSKYQAELGLKRLEDENFRVCILRPPMVYGKGCKGNYRTLTKLVEKYPVFPRLDNKRSVLSIENLCGFLKIAVDERLEGVYFPQDRERVCTSDMAMWIAEGMGKKRLFSRAAGLAVKGVMPLSVKARKAFCSLCYEGTETMDYRYCSVDSKTAVLRSVR